MNKSIKTVKSIGQEKKQEKVAAALFSDQMSNSLQTNNPKPLRVKRASRKEINNLANCASRKQQREQAIHLTPEDWMVLNHILKLQTEFDTNPKYQDYEKYKRYIIDGEHYVEFTCEELAKRFKCPLSTMNDRLLRLQKAGVLKAVRKYEGRGLQTLMYRVEGLDEYREARDKKKEEKQKEQDAKKAKKRAEKKAKKQEAKRVTTANIGNAIIKNINNIFSHLTAPSVAGKSIYKLLKATKSICCGLKRTFKGTPKRLGSSLKPTNSYRRLTKEELDILRWSMEPYREQCLRRADMLGYLPKDCYNNEANSIDWLIRARYLAPSVIIAMARADNYTNDLQSVAANLLQKYAPSAKPKESIRSCFTWEYEFVC